MSGIIIGFVDGEGNPVPGLFTRCCTIYDEEKVAAITPYPHVADTLSALRDRGLKHSVVTDAHNGNALKRLRKAGLKRIF